MHADSGTLRDLEILPTDPGRLSLFSVLDRTRSRAGHEALRARIDRPMSDRGRIRSTQLAVAHLAARATALRTSLDRMGLDEAEQYLGLIWTTSQRRFGLFRLIEGAWLATRYRDLIRDVGTGLARLLVFLAESERLLDAVGDRPPGDLEAHCRTARALLDGAGLAPLRRKGAQTGSVVSLLRLDRIARADSRADLLRLIAIIGDLEALLSLGVTTTGPGWTFPEIDEGAGRGIEWEGLGHPFLTAGVPNDLAPGASTRVVLLTGPNMAGKTTFMRAAGLAVYLTHLGAGVRATRFRTPLFGAVFASIQIVDSIQHHESFFLSEVRRVKALAELLHRKAAVFGIVDEPFRGTNIHDGAAATEALVSGLARHPGAMIVISTHITEVAETLAASPGIALRRFEATVAADGPRFDYRLTSGISTQRLGMELLRREGVLDLLGSWPAPTLG